MTLRELLVGKSVGRSLIRGLSLAALLLVISRVLLVPVRAHGISMMPTYYEGQFIFVNKLAYRFAPLRRGDIVALTIPGKESVFVKRIIALPGESVRIEEGQVFVNDAALDEPYVRFRAPWEVEEHTLEANEVFVIGDNRSMPSRLHEFGRADRDRILGRVAF